MQDPLPEHVTTSDDEVPVPQTPQGRSWGRALLALLRDVFESVVLAVVLFFLLQNTVQNTVVEGSSMEPALVDGQRLLVNKLAYKFSSPQRGDIVVFHAPHEPGKDFIKRIIGLPGEKVEVRDGRVYINDQLLEESYLPRTGGYSWGPRVVGPDEYFVLGDNRGNSSDSHSWGMLPAKLIVGKAWISLWPPERFGPLTGTSGDKE
jgi:signal peptidase I